MYVDPNPFSRKIIIADLDGCLVDSMHRTQHFFSGDHAKYYAESVNDKAIPQGAAVYQHFARDPQYLMVYITSRWDIPHYRQTTINQVRQWVDGRTCHEQLLMRLRGIDGNDMSDAKMKPLVFERAGYRYEDVFMAFDDRKSVVDMWRAKGIICYETQPSDY